MTKNIIQHIFLRLVAIFLFAFIVLIPMSDTQFFSADVLKDVLNQAGVGLAEQSVPLPKVDNKNTSEKKANYIIYEVIKILLIISGVVAVVFIVLGGTEYTISAGEEDRLNGAKAKIKYALIGLLIVIFSYAILTNVINFLEVAE